MPIRFGEEVLLQVKQLADRDGLTVSSWVRRVVEREVERELRLRSVTQLSEYAIALARDIQGLAPLPETRTEESDEAKVVEVTR
jgi:hypothetical protein